MSSNSRSPGHSFFSATDWAELADALRLTGRELEIVHRVFGEMNTAAIAKELGISERTVHKQLERLYAKLHIHSRVGLILRILDEHRALTLD